MNRVVAVDKDLGSLSAALHHAGYEVVGLEPEHISTAAAVVLTGGADDMLGFMRSRTDAPVIAARGLSAAEVVALLDSRLGIRPH